MDIERKHFVFTTLAMYQTPFFMGVARELTNMGYNASIISFHQRSHEYLIKENIKSYDVFFYLKRKDINRDDIDICFNDLVEKYNIHNDNIILSHEKISFNVSNSTKIKCKFIRYFKSLEIIFQEIESTGEKIILIQEVGGFSSILSTYYLAKSKKYDHIFMEPSFFRGRLFLTKNTINAPTIKQKKVSDVSDVVKQYVEITKIKKAIVIPVKDKYQYNNPWKKIFNVYNIKRFFQKVVDKYFLNKEEEFDQIFNFSTRHLKMFIKKILLMKYYTSLPDKQFIYFPFHVPMDVALTVRSPEFVDQYSLVDYIARAIPGKYKLVIKEHPAMIGILNYSRIKDLLKRNDNIILLAPSINNFDVIKKCDLVITVNSKSGAEAIMTGGKVFVLGDAFYKNAKLVYKLNNISCLSNEIYDTLHDKKCKTNDVEILKYFQSVFECSHDGELYVDDTDNYKNVVNSIISFL